MKGVNAVHWRSSLHPVLYANTPQRFGMYHFQGLLIAQKSLFQGGFHTPEGLNVNSPGRNVGFREANSPVQPGSTKPHMPPPSNQPVRTQIRIEGIMSKH